MEVMTLHRFIDGDIKRIVWNVESGTHSDVRRIDLVGDRSVMICKEDIIALAKEFNLMVFEKTSAL